MLQKTDTALSILSVQNYEKLVLPQVAVDCLRNCVHVHIKLFGNCHDSHRSATQKVCHALGDGQFGCQIRIAGDVGAPKDGLVLGERDGETDRLPQCSQVRLSVEEAKPLDAAVRYLIGGL